jgi:hypothetical protein
MGRSQSPASFAEQFGIHHAIQLAISTAFRSRTAVHPAALANALIARYPGTPANEIRDAIAEAVLQANVPMKSVPEAALAPETRPKALIDLFALASSSADGDEVRRAELVRLDAIGDDLRAPAGMR